MLQSVVFSLWDRLMALATYVLQRMLLGSLVLTLAHALGWVDRLLWFAAEQTATFLWNGTPVTIGSLQVDLWHGRVWATNIIVHTPKRDEWKWESPLIGRIGRIYVESNWVQSLAAMAFRMICGKGQHQILELYTIEVSDVQGFMERKQHIFNFYLMDRLMILPDPKEILLMEQREQAAGACRSSNKTPGASGSQHPAQKPQTQRITMERQPSMSDDMCNDTNSEIATISVDLNFDPQDQVETSCFMENPQNNYNPPDHSSTTTDSNTDDPGAEDNATEHRQAQKLVDDMFNAVKSLGQAARDKGSLTRALLESRNQFTSKLKDFKGTKNKSEAMQEGVKVIQRVGKAVAKKTKDIHKWQPKMPPRRAPDAPPVYGRVGRIIVEDARIFTRASNTTVKDPKSSPNSSAKASESTAGSAAGVETRSDCGISTPTAESHSTQKPHSEPNLHEEHTPAATSTSDAVPKWNKPIVIQEIVLRASDLCPPTSLVDENGLPAIYQPLDKIIEVVWKRVMVGMAKSNTRRFLQTALGEVLDLEYLNLNLNEKEWNDHLSSPIVNHNIQQQLAPPQSSNSIKLTQQQQQHHQQPPLQPHLNDYGYDNHSDVGSTVTSTYYEGSVTG